MASHARSNAKRHDYGSRVPAWVWLFTGAVLGAFIMFLMHLSDVNQNVAATPPKQKAKQEEKAEKPRFDFYELLKENEVPITVPEHQPRSESTAETQQKEEFILQVASFQGADDAERLRAELLLLNLDAYTEEAKIRNGEVWHRVLVGPFSSKSTLSKARNTLLSNHHEALVLKRQPQS